MQINLNPNNGIRDKYVDNLLIQRGLNKNDLYKFYNPDSSLIEPPTNLNNIEEAAEKFFITMRTATDVCLIVDSDVDGYTSSAIMWKFIKEYYPQVNIDYIMHEHKGHGLSDVIDKVLEKSYDLVILPDSSSNDYEFHERIGKELGSWCLVLDHHIVEKPIYSEYAIIVNNQISEKYLNKELCGVGVTWQFCRYIDKTYYNSGFYMKVIDLVALGIVSDMMSMLSLENRALIDYGFSHINNYFFQSLCNKQNFSMKGKVNPTTVAFYIAPLINSVTRVGTMEEKNRCFLAFIDGHTLVQSHARGAKTGDFVEVAIESARECGNIRARQNRILDKATEELEIKISKYDLLENEILFIRLDEEQYPPELNGLIAMKLSAKYHKPTIVARLNSEGFNRGSLRGLNDSALTDFKQFLWDSGLFEYTAGHPNAAGISIRDDLLDELHSYGNTNLSKLDLTEKVFTPDVAFTGEDFLDIEQAINEIVEGENFWGQHNPEPMLYISNIKFSKKDVQIMGKTKDTVKISKDGIAYMFFKQKDTKKFLETNDSILTVVGKANLNEWNGTTTPQIFVEEFEIGPVDIFAF